MDTKICNAIPKTTESFQRIKKKPADDNKERSIINTEQVAYHYHSVSDQQGKQEKCKTHLDEVHIFMRTHLSPSYMKQHSSQNSEDSFVTDVKKS